MDSIVKWEYKIVPIGFSDEFEKQLSELGQVGWEAVSYAKGTGFVLKRPCGEISITKHISQEQGDNTASYDSYER